MNEIKRFQRRLSLDGCSYPLEPAAVQEKLKGFKRRSLEDKNSHGLLEAQQELQEFNRNQQRSSLPRHSVGEEGFDHNDGLITRHSFKNHNKTFHKIFPEISEAEDLTHAFTCALQKEVVYHGKLYVTEKHVCFYSSVLLKETKVVMRVCKVQMVKKKHTARVVPNALAIITDDGDKYLFVSLRNRDTCLRLLYSVCPQLQGLSGNCSPQMSSTENGAEMDSDTMSSHSSLEDGTDHHHRASHGPDLGQDASPPLGSAPPNLTQAPDRDGSNARGSTTHEDHAIEEDTAVSWVSMVTEKVKSILSPRESSSISCLLIFYLILVLMLLLSSGYIGLRIMALEDLLSTLGSEFSLQREETHPRT